MLFRSKAVSDARWRELATRLGAALRSWGAGRRQAPEVRPVAEITAWLTDGGHQRDLRTVASAAELGSEAADEGELASALVRLYRSIAEEILKSRTQGRPGLTYCSKTLLLLTGFGPAFDSQVRAGLGHVSRRSGWAPALATKIFMVVRLDELRAPLGMT